jgi:hypothetical protein
MILKIFSPKYFANKLAFIAQTTTLFWQKNRSESLVFGEKCHFWPKIVENRRKL